MDTERLKDRKAYETRIHQIGSTVLPIAEEEYERLNEILDSLIHKPKSQRRIDRGIIYELVMSYINDAEFTSPLVAVIIPHYEYMRCDFNFDKILDVLLSWPQTENVSSLILPLLKHRKLNAPFLAKCPVLLIKLIPSLYNCRLLRGTLSTLETLLRILNQQKLFYAILPSILKVLQAYVSNEFSALVSDTLTIQDVQRFGKVLSNSELSPYCLCMSKTKAIQIIHDFIKIQLMRFFNDWRPFKSMIAYLDQLPIDTSNEQDLESRLQICIDSHDNMIQPATRYFEVPKVLKNKFLEENRVTGLVNIHGTCYLNSYLQVLYMSYEFRENILNIKGSGLIEDLRYLFGSLYQTKRASIVPLDTFMHIPSYMQERRQDAAEFGQVLFNLIEESSKQSNLDNPISTYFTGLMMTTINCNNHNHRSFNTEEFREILLSVPNVSNEVNLSDLIGSFFQEEELLGDDKYFCSHCAELVDSTKKVFIRKAPKHLIFNFQRNQYNKLTNSNYKVMTPISCRKDLEITVYISEHESQKVTYELYGIINHGGCSISRGNYYSVTRNTLQINTSRWIKFEDVNISEVCDVKSAFSSSSDDVVYMLFYVLKSEPTALSNPVPLELLERIAEEDKVWCNV